MNADLAQEIANLLEHREEKIVLAESCTAGLVAATLGRVSGISTHLCGSAVVYRADLKRRWLGVKRSTIRRFTTESREVVAEMAVGVLRESPKADWGVAVVGHLGPNAPKEKDGEIHVCIARRTKKGKIKVKDYYCYCCKSTERIMRQQEATEVVLTQMARILHKREGHEKTNGQAKPDKRKRKLAKST